MVSPMVAWVFRLLLVSVTEVSASLSTVTPGMKTLDGSINFGASAFASCVGSMFSLGM